MVARNFSVQELPYSRLLQVPEDEQNCLSLDEAKVHLPQQQQQQTMPPHYQHTYYDLSNTLDDSCVSTIQYSQTSQSTPGSMNSNSMMEMQRIDSTYSTSRRKRKASFSATSDFDEDGGDDNKSVRTTDENKKQNHSEIEKRRRDKMNTYITELSSMVPMCHAMSRKLDKLTVLRMAVQHLKSIRGAVHSYTEGHYKPSFLSDQELKHLILQVADGFLFVVGCDRGRILYVSKSVSKVLNYSQGDLLGQSWFDILHPKDVAKVKEQLSSSDLNPRERLIDAKTMLPLKTDVPPGVTRLCPGARRSFFCRMKCKTSIQVKEEADTTTGCHRRKKQNSDKRYNVIQCTGYLKSWAPAKIGLEENEAEGDDTCNLSCLVAVGRVLPHISLVAANAHGRPKTVPIQFISRHTMDGKFLFVDQRATLVLGFLPQELLGTSMYEYYHHEDIHALAECHKCALQNSDRITTNIYRFRTKDGGFVRLQSEWKSFKNPWTKETEYLIAKNNLILTDLDTVESSAEPTDKVQDYDFFQTGNGREIQRIINTHVEVSKIGRQIADQVIDSQRRQGESSSDSSPDPESSLSLSNTNSNISTNFLNDQQRLNDIIPEFARNTSSFSNVRNNFPLSNVSNDPGSGADEEIIEMMEDAVRESPGNGPPTDGNDEAAMAVIMSLLEADAGLGGPVDFSGLPWPLP
ncbi:protein cycle isoform X3 [Agrilus planipennis]|uniref:Protein cycle isoform X3 n=1 Tax=Agrilus planipennis TaxID=224129 RepID=A0A7F5R7R4_AGRPL|nr:protein cycle isoform X3 [Agrilus planipennis]